MPQIRSLPLLDLAVPVTFFVGENGSGRSTLLEGIAAAELDTMGDTRDVVLDRRSGTPPRRRPSPRVDAAFATRVLPSSRGLLRPSHGAG